jgi:hypothetical protein
VPAPADESRYARFRRRLAPVALVIAIGVLVHENCKGKQAAGQAIELRFGAHRAEVTRVRADVLVGGTPVAHFERDLTAGGDAPVALRALTEDDPAVIVVDLATTHGPRRVTRDLAPDPGATIVVDLSRELDAAARP